MERVGGDGEAGLLQAGGQLARAGLEGVGSAILVAGDMGFERAVGGDLHRHVHLTQPFGVQHHLKAADPLTPAAAPGPRRSSPPCRWRSSRGREGGGGGPAAEALVKVEPAGLKPGPAEASSPPSPPPVCVSPVATAVTAIEVATAALVREAAAVEGLPEAAAAAGAAELAVLLETEEASRAAGALMAAAATRCPKLSAGGAKAAGGAGGVGTAAAASAAWASTVVAEGAFDLACVSEPGSATRSKSGFAAWASALIGGVGLSCAKATVGRAINVGGVGAATSAGGVAVVGSGSSAFGSSSAAFETSGSAAGVVVASWA